MPVPAAGALPAAPVIPAGSLRLSGSAGCPRWRGRLHLAAAVAAVPAGAALVARRPSLLVALYALGLTAQFAVSSAYHLIPFGARARRRMRQADHATIYFFTAASVTVFCRYAVGGGLGVAVAAAAWAGASIGVTMKVAAFDRSAGTGAALYLLLGWLAAVTLPRAVPHLAWSQMALLGAVAAFYSAGVVVLFTRHPDPAPATFGYHEVWHAAVVAASACYFAVVWGLVHPV